MPHAVVSGYFGHGNLGDETILAATVAGLRRAVPGLRLTVLSARPHATAVAHGVAAVKRTDARAVDRALREADVLLSGGGGLLQDVTGPWSIPYYVGVIALARRHRVPVMIFAQGVGPVRGRLGRLLVRRALPAAEAVTVRDSESRDLLRALGVRVPVTVTADAALLLEPPAVPAPRVRALLPGGDGPLVTVSLRRRGLEEAAARDALRAGLERLAVRTGARLLFVPMQPAEDVPVAEQVAAGLDAPGRVLRGPLTPAEAAALLGGAELAVGMRLHALVLAALGGSAPAGISYDPKVDRFLTRLGLQPLSDARSLAVDAGWCDRLQRAYRERARLAQTAAAGVRRLRRAAAENLRVAARLLRGPGGGDDLPA